MPHESEKEERTTESRGGASYKDAETRRGATKVARKLAARVGPELALAAPAQVRGKKQGGTRTETQAARRPPKEKERGKGGTGIGGMPTGPQCGSHNFYMAAAGSDLPGTPASSQLRINWMTWRRQGMGVEERATRRERAASNASTR